MTFSGDSSTDMFNPTLIYQEGVRAMVKEKIKGKIVMVSSVAGFVSFLGYSGYSPTKAALRGNPFLIMKDEVLLNAFMQASLNLYVLK